LNKSLKNGRQNIPLTNLPLPIILTPNHSDESFSSLPLYSVFRIPYPFFRILPHKSTRETGPALPVLVSLNRMKKTVPSLVPEAALSIELGEGCHAKDFDWMARNVPCRSACPARTDIPGY